LRSKRSIEEYAGIRTKDKAKITLKVDLVMDLKERKARKHKHRGLLLIRESYYSEYLGEEE
jgi:hypothetical protein